MLLGVWGNISTKPGPLVPKKAFLDAHHPTHMSALYADSLGWDESLGILMRFQNEDGSPRALVPRDIKLIKEFHEEIEDFIRIFGDSLGFNAVVLSIADYDRITFDGGRGTKPYLKEDMTGLEFEEFMHYVKANPGIYGQLVGKDFSFITYIVFLEPGFDANALSQAFSEHILQGGVALTMLQTHLEMREFPAATIHPLGWLIARFWITRMLSVDNMKLVTFGILLLLIFFFLHTQSLRHTLLFIVGVYVPVLLFVRGSIGFLDATGIFAMKERVFITLPFALTLVLVISIASHVWNVYVSVLREGKEPLSHIRKNVGGVLSKAMFVAFVSFVLAALMTDLRTMAEIGILFALSLVYTWYISMEILPRILEWKYFALSRKNVEEKSFLENLFQRISIYAYARNLVTKPWMVFVLMSLMLISSGIIFQKGYFHFGGGSERYLNGTPFETSITLMNEDGMPGFGTLDFIVTCESDVYGEISHRNPLCISRIYTLAHALLQDDRIREVYSLPNGQLSHLSDSLLYKKTPSHELDVEKLFESLESSSSYFDTEEYMLFDNGYRLVLSTIYSEGTMLQSIRESLITLAQDFEGVSIHPFGSNAIWADMDSTTVKNSIANMFQDVLVLFFLVCIYVSIGAKGNMRRYFSPWKVGIAVSIPFVFTTMVMIFLMSIFNIPLDTSTGSINQMVVAAAADFLFFLLAAYCIPVCNGISHTLSSLHAFMESGKAVTGDAFFNSVAFLLLLTSSFEPIRMLGLLLIVAVLSTWYATMFLVLPTMRWALKSV